MSKVDIIREKYSRIKDNTFNFLVENDKTPTKKYLEKMCFYWSTKGNSRLYSKTLVAAIKDFDNLLPYIENKDIYSQKYNKFNELINTIESAKLIKFEKEFKREDHIEVIYETDKYLVLQPKTFEGSLKYGANTRWCTAGVKYANTYHSYIKGNYLIYVIDKKNRDVNINKIALLIQHTSQPIITSLFLKSIDIYNPLDNSVRLEWFVKNGWDEDDLMTIMMNIQLFIYRNEKVRKIKSSVKETAETISSINLIEMIKNIDILKNINHINDTEVQNHKKIIDNFISKIQELSNTY